MVPKEFLLIAGDAEGDGLAAALVTALRSQLTSAETGYDEGLQPLHASVEPRFYGAGGSHLADAGVELLYTLEALPVAAAHRLRRLLAFRRVFGGLYRLALEREPHAIIGVGVFGFNLRFAHRLKRYVRHRQGTFCNWDPLFIQLGAPPGWTSRASRVRQAANDIDLLLSTDSSEEARYGNHAPALRDASRGPLPGVAHSPEVAVHAARAIVQVLLESEGHFPLRAYLGGA